MKTIARLVGLFVFGVACAAPATAAHASAPVTLYVDEYAEGQVMTHIARILIERETDTPARIKTVSVGPAFLGVAHDDRSLFMAAWLPRTHAGYMERVGDQVEDLGELFDGARIGWVVPAYVPKDKLDSITDLKQPAIAKRVDRRIQGISAGAGEMHLSKKALGIYGLDDYRLVTASSAAMTGALAAAIKNHEWIVVTGWSPHWMWGRFDLRYLKDPKGALGSREHVDAIASQKLDERAPEVYDLISHMHYSLEQINGALEYAEQHSYEQAATHFIDTHPDVIAEWTGASTQ